MHRLGTVSPGGSQHDGWMLWGVRYRSQVQIVDFVSLILSAVKWAESSEKVKSAVVQLEEPSPTLDRAYKDRPGVVW